MIAWFTFLIGSSVAEAHFWHHYAGRHPKGLDFRNIHLWLVLMRSGVLLATFGGNTIFYVLSFPLFHDGLYYTVRNYLRPGTYPNGFFDISTTSTAVLTMPFHIRAIMAVVGAATLLF